MLLVIAKAGVEAQQSLRLTGRTSSVRVVEDKQDVIVELDLDLTIKNEASSTVILFWQDVGIVGHWIYQNTDPMRPNLLYFASALPSTSISPFWANLRKQLDVAAPPANLTKTLKSGESINFSRTTTLSIYKKGHYPAQWSEIAASSPVWLKVTLDMFPSNLDQTSFSQKFGPRLKKKWAALGVLKIDSLQSEPIKLDLNVSEKGPHN